MNQHTSSPELAAGWGDFVPEVNPTDLRSVSRMMREFQKQHPGVCGAIGGDSFKRECREGADVFAVWMRAAMLEMLLRVMPEALVSHVRDGEFDDSVIQVAATISMKNIGTGITHEGMPFDVDEFTKKVGG